MNDRLNKFLTNFAFHLYDTHGIPLEITERMFEDSSLTTILVYIVKKHKDFRCQY
jgi:alanyl-tRNA synthetase